jgi:hypothetical protein
VATITQESDLRHSPKRNLDPSFLAVVLVMLGHGQFVNICPGSMQKEVIYVA